MRGWERDEENLPREVWVMLLPDGSLRRIDPYTMLPWVKLAYFERGWAWEDGPIDDRLVMQMTEEEFALTELNRATF